MKKISLILLAMFILVVSAMSKPVFNTNESVNNKSFFADTNYLAEIKVELKKTWPKNRVINLVFHGHSVVAGYTSTPNITTMGSYPMLVLKKVTEKFPTVPVNIIRTAIGGEQAEQGAKRFAKTVLNHQPDVLFIDYALNDRYIGIDRAQKAWESMVKKVLKKNIKVILLTPTPDLKEDIKSDSTALETHRQMILALGEKYKIPVVDSYGIFKKMALEGIDLKPYMAQNNHPNEKGHQLVADEICKLFAIQ